MKVLLSWLRDFAPFEGDPVALGETLSDLGMAGRGARCASARASTASSWPGCSRPRRIEAPTRSTSSTSTPATASRSRSAAARSTWPPATSCRWPPSAPSCRTAWRSAAARCRGVVERDAVLAARARASATTTAASSSCRRTSRRARPSPRRWASSATSSTTSRSTPTGPTRCRSPASPATSRRALGLPFTLPEPRSPSPARRRRRRVASRSSTPTGAAGSRPACCRGVQRRARRPAGSPPGSRCSACARSTTWSTCRTT